MVADVDQKHPFVSVIVPVYNDPLRIGRCIEALLSQTYPHDRYEVIIVDNGSTDATPAVVRSYPVTLLVERDVRSSYAARNRGVANAKGSVVALTDSDCTPVPSWIEAGVQALHTQDADLVGGNVRFVPSRRPTGAEIYDSLSNLQVERNVHERGVAVTANLFARADVFARVGPFSSSLQSGGDIMWTQQATKQGLKLVYAPAAEVAHPTRRLGALLKKQYRVGKGHAKLRRRGRAAVGNIAQSVATTQRSSKVSRLSQRIFGTLKGFTPDPPALLQESARQHQLHLSWVALYRVWFAGWLCRIATTLGWISSAVEA